MIPVVDLFAGPGGLGEGFSGFRNGEGEQAFKIVLSIEKDPIAHKTLKLRSFFRQFNRKQVPKDYYDCLQGTISIEELYKRHPKESVLADEEAWNAELGNDRKFSARKIDDRVRKSLRGHKDWLLIGGPPCQAYSLVGRSRVIPVDREKYEADKRHFLYKAYLRIIAEHRPSAFVLENVKGILSAEVGGERIIDRILADLRHPVPASQGKEAEADPTLEYTIFPLADYESRAKLFDRDRTPDPSDYIIRAERHRIPQARHRLILLGVRNDVLQQNPDLRIGKLRTYKDQIAMWRAISDLPKLRSRLSSGEDSGQRWAEAVRAITSQNILRDPIVDHAVAAAIRSKAEKVSATFGFGKEFLPCNGGPKFRADWYRDARLGGVCNHVTRGHMKSDLWRYFFAACYAAVHKKSPKIPDFPSDLLPNHENVKNVAAEKMVFKDRFRVQVRTKPGTTVTSHIGKDGHYFIHPDAMQCRSLTVREAARLQTFPDNYYFVGPITAKYQQVGNAVPPLLAHQVAEIVYEIFGGDFEK